QARYAIRHAWQGKIACESPKRGVWGGPWPGCAAGATSPSGPVAATKLAHAPRGPIDLSKVLADLGSAVATNVAGDIGARDADAESDAAGDAASGDAPSPSSSRCGCRTPGGGAPFGAGALLGLALAASALVRRLVCSEER